MTGQTSRFKLTTFGDNDLVDPFALNAVSSQIDTLINCVVDQPGGPTVDGQWYFLQTFRKLGRYNLASNTSDIVAAGTQNNGRFVNYKNTTGMQISAGSTPNFRQLVISNDIEGGTTGLGAEFLKIIAQGHFAVYGTPVGGANIDVYPYIALDTNASAVPPSSVINGTGAMQKVTLSTNRIGARVPYYIDTVFDARYTTVNFFSLNFWVDTSTIPSGGLVGFSSADATAGYNQMWIHGMGDGG